MFSDEMISLDCPCCREAIYQPLSWFKKTYTTCPACSAGLAAGQFAAAIGTLEEAFDARVEELVLGKPQTGCCGGHHS